MIHQDDFIRGEVFEIIQKNATSNNGIPEPELVISLACGKGIEFMKAAQLIQTRFQNAGYLGRVDAKDISSAVKSWIELNPTAAKGTLILAKLKAPNAKNLALVTGTLSLSMACAVGVFAILPGSKDLAILASVAGLGFLGDSIYNYKKYRNWSYLAPQKKAPPGITP